MKKIIIFIAVFAVFSVSVCSAYADTLARDAMITYTGTDAFTKLTSLERQACVNWLVHGGTMDERCSKAVMKLVSDSPNAVTAEQRQALIAEASGINETTAQTQTTTQTQTPAPAETEQPKISKKNDDTGKIVAIGLLGLLAGLVIHNNVSHHKSAPSYNPEPPRHAPHMDRTPPNMDRRPPQANRPPQRPMPQPQRVNRPMDKRPPRR